MIKRQICFRPRFDRAIVPAAGTFTILDGSPAAAQSLGMKRGALTEVEVEKE